MDRRKLPVGLLAMAATGIAMPVQGQVESGAPWVFEVASIKEHPLPPNQYIIRLGSPPRLQPQGDRFTFQKTNLSWLIMDAYNVREYQILGLPGWAQGLDCDHFDIAAKSEKTPNADQLRQMVQSLLAFGLKFHREMRDLPVYALVVGKNGSKLRKLREDEKVPTYTTRPPRMATEMGSFAGLVDLIAMQVDRPVIDQTGLSGDYEHARLDWALFGRERRGTAGDDVSGLSIFTALQQELGLKLEPRKSPTEVLVVDHAEKPSAN